MSAQFHMLSQSLSSKRMLASLPCKRMFANIHLPTSLEFSRISSCPCNRTPEVRGKIRSTHALPDLKDSLWEDIPTPVLDKIDNPANLKYLTPKELKQLAADIRSELCLMMPRMQNHLKASLTCVELTIAVHYVFKAPVDKILWDSDNQNYTHMLLTGRRSFVDTVSSSNGIPISTSPGNNEYDQFGSAHGCSSISVGLGMAVARDIKGKRERVVTVINNESTMAGQVYEAMSSAGYLDSNLIVILNDTSHSLHRKPDEGSGTPINVLSSTFGKLQASKSFRKMRELAKAVVKKIGKGMHEWAAKVDEYARGMMGPTGSTLFEELGLYYIGPIDGHNIEDLICVLQEVASLDSMGPVLVHVLTNEKKEAVASPTTNLKEKIIEGCVDSLPSAIHLQTYGDCFVEALSIQVQKDKDIVAVYAGMGMDPSLGQFHKRFPDRFFDVGMAEQHAVTFSAGLARGGLKPFCIIPSAFLKRSYDQVVHDVDHQKIPVRFAIPSAGLTGPFDEAFMSCMPNMIVMAPSDETELASMVALSAQVDDRPICFRYPSTVVAGMFKSSESTMPIEIGKGRILVEGKDVALLGYGSMVQNCLSARSLLSELGVDVTVADARFCKPLDINLVRELCKNHAFLITVEEGSIGGFGSHVAHFIALDGGLDGKVKWRPVVLPDTYIEKASRKEQLALAGLTGHHIAATALSLLGRTRDALLLMC